MQIKIRTLLVAISFLAAACSEAPDQETGAPAGTINVSVGAAQQVSIKPFTSMGDDGVTIKWVAGDKMAMWAINSQGTATLEAQPFVMYHYNSSFDDAKFTANIPVMNEDTYKYYAVSPTPDAVNGTMASFDIPAVQDGQRTLACDVMVAAPVEGDALQQGDNSKFVNLKFSHKIHVLKIRIPANEMGMSVTALELTFPVPVTGRMTLDASAPEAPVQLSQTEEGKTLTLEFDEPKSVGDEVFAVIAPVELDPTDEIQIKAYSDKKESYPTRMPGKNFQAAHTTPISLTIPQLYRITRIRFSLNGDGTSTLGEKINSFTLEAPAGVDLGTGSATRTFAFNEDNKYEIAYEGEYTDNLSGKAFTIKYDSENAVVSSAFTMPQIEVDGSNDVDPFTVPYLYVEDFSGVNGQGYDDTKGKDNGSGYSLASLNLPGWSGQRIGSKTGTSVRINSCHYHAGGFGGASNYHGSLTSSPLTALKPGKTVKVTVSFLANRSSDNTLGYFGSTTSTGNPTFSNSGQSTISATTKDDYIEIDTANEFPLTVTSANRLWWNVSNNDKSGGFLSGVTNRHYLYIDQVKVSISK